MWPIKMHVYDKAYKCTSRFTIPEKVRQERDRERTEVIGVNG